MWILPATQPIVIPKAFLERARWDGFPYARRWPNSVRAPLELRRTKSNRSEYAEIIFKKPNRLWEQNDSDRHGYRSQERESNGNYSMIVVFTGAGILARSRLLTLAYPMNLRASDSPFEQPKRYSMRPTGRSPPWAVGLIPQSEPSVAKFSGGPKACQHKLSSFQKLACIRTSHQQRCSYSFHGAQFGPKAHEAINIRKHLIGQIQNLTTCNPSIFCTHIVSRFVPYAICCIKSTNRTD